MNDISKLIVPGDRNFSIPTEQERGNPDTPVGTESEDGIPVNAPPHVKQAMRRLLSGFAKVAARRGDGEMHEKLRNLIG